MAIKFDMLGSGSAGNCGLVITNESIILIDAGFSCKKIKELLAKRIVSLEQISAVFVTHEHTDHIQGLRGLRKFDNIKFFANKNTASAIEQKFDFKINWQSFSTGDRLKLNDLSITSFSVPHDAADPIGYVFATEPCDDGQLNSIAWMTDLGYVPSHVAEYVSDVDLLVIESNYDNDLLTVDTKRPPYVKARIRGRYGHLPNEAAINFIKSNKSNKWKKIVFAHVSADCNNESSIKKLLGEQESLTFEFDIAKA